MGLKRFAQVVVVGSLRLFAVNSLDEGDIDAAIDIAGIQLEGLASILGYPQGTPQYADYTNTEGEWDTLKDRTVWTSGMVAGMYWYMFELTGESNWQTLAEYFTDGMDGAEYEDDQDLGFQVYNSYGIGYRLTGRESYKTKVLQAAETLTVLRYQEDIGAFYAWKEPSRRPEWERAVNIDMIMNIELILQADILNGTKTYEEKAIKHAKRTWKDLVRSDRSTWHVADYTNFSDGIIDKGTYQGWTDNSTWTRGQAWAVYGYAMMFRLTGIEKYFKRSMKLNRYFMENLPTDNVAYADFDAPIIDQCRDSSATAIVASALLDLYQLVGNEEHLEQAKVLLDALLGEDYLVNPDTSSYKSILMKGCQEWGESEVGTITGDYFFVEALVRYKRYAA